MENALFARKCFRHTQINREGALTKWLAVVSLIVFGATSCTTPPEVWPSAIASLHSVAESYLLAEQWSRAEVMAQYVGSGAMLAAADGKVFILGRLGRNEESSVIALSASDGSLAWRASIGDEWDLSVTPDSLYVGDSTVVARVSSYDLETGGVQWSRHLWSNSILYIVAEGGRVSVNVNPDRFYVLGDDTGDILQRVRSSDPIFLSTDTVTYMRQPFSNALQAISVKDGELLWEVQVANGIYHPPVFTENAIYIRTGIELGGQVYAIDRQTGEILWETEQNVVSNVAVAENTVFLLTEDGYLMGLDRDTGEAVAYVLFSPAPFLFSSQE